jgi:hypothetical protein
MNTEFEKWWEAANKNLSAKELAQKVWEIQQEKIDDLETNILFRDLGVN